MGGVLSSADGDVGIRLGRHDYALACRLIREYAGIRLSPHKHAMVYNRLLRRLRECRADSFTEYLARVQRPGSDEREAFVNALTTNLTAFFREPHHFELLRARAEAHARACAGRPMRVWSSACSTGEEAWSIAMTLHEAACPAEIVASDIDTEVLETARAGIYRAESASNLGAARLRAHFLHGRGDNEGWVSVRPQLRQAVRFLQVNLQSATWPMRGPFDAIFCRNVVIYFDREAQQQLLARLAIALRPGGALFVGHAESFPSGHREFRSCGRTAYERVAL